MKYMESVPMVQVEHTLPWFWQRESVVVFSNVLKASLCKYVSFILRIREVEWSENSWLKGRNSEGWASLWLLDTFSTLFCRHLPQNIYSTYFLFPPKEISFQRQDWIIIFLCYNIHSSLHTLHYITYIYTFVIYFALYYIVFLQGKKLHHTESRNLETWVKFPLLP